MANPPVPAVPNVRVSAEKTSSPPISKSTISKAVNAK